jgi:hypothetical protein
MAFAKEGRSRGKVTKPAVIGAVIDLGFCLDLTGSPNNTRKYSAIMQSNG